ncbi:hypothetical protein MHYP_G00114600 [Metynnis hypsauchen]
MSNNYYKSSPDDYRSRQDMYPDSYQWDDAYRQRTRSASQETMHSAASSSRPADSSALVPGKALSFLQSCGLDASDLSLLAELPEHLITVETLPKLLLQLKESKLSSSSSSRSSTTQPCAKTSSHAYESSTHVQAVGYSLDRSVRPSYPLPPDQVQSWQDRWGNRRKTSSTSSGTDSKTSTIVDYNHSRDGLSYYNEQPYTSAASNTSSTISHSYTDYSKAPTQNSEHSHVISADPVFKVPTRKEASDFHGILPPVFPYACVLCNITVLIEKDWSVHIRGVQHAHSQLELVKKYPEWDQNVESAKRNARQATQQPRSTKAKDPYQSVPSRKEVSDVQGRIPPVFPIPSEKKDLSGNVRNTQHDNSQLKLVEKYPGWDQNIDSTNRNESQGVTQTKLFENQVERRYKTPTRKEASDFRGKVPPVFPYACVLCDITVLSEKDWSVHTRGVQHANGQLRLVERYPQWDQKIRSTRRNVAQVLSQAASTETKEGGSQKESKKKNTSDKEKRSNTKTPPKDHGRVVCVTFAASSVDEEYLKKLLGQFGAVVKVMMFPALALVEMGSKDQSGDIVKYFTDNPLAVEGKRIEFSISTTFSFLQSSRVVSFSPLPARDGTTSELMAIAKRFGSVKTSLFLPSRGYVEMTDPADAKKLVEHYITKPLKLKGKAVQVTFSTEYDTLIDLTVDEKAQSLSSYSQGGSSPRRRSSQRDSPSPKRRRSSERNCSSRNSRLNERNDRQRSRDKLKTLSKTSLVSSHCSTNDETTKPQSEDVEVKISVNSDIVASMDSDSDLEGLAVIADDGEELQHDDDEPIDHQKMDQEQKICEVAQQDDQTSSTSEAFPEQDASSGREEVKHLTRQSQENSPSGAVGIPSVHSDVKVETLQDASKTLDSLKKDQKPEEQKDEVLDINEEDFDFPESLENCITLDELVEETSSDYQESDKQNPSTPTAEDILDEEPTTRNPPPPSSYMDSEENKKQSESPKEESTNSTAGETKAPEHESVNTDDQCLEQQDREKDTSNIKEEFGKVLDVRNLPKAEDYTDSDFINIAKRYGEVKHYLLIRDCRKGFVEMVHASDAERIAADSKNQDVALRGNALKIKVSVKYSSLPTAGFNPDSDDEENTTRANSEDSTDDNQSVAGAESEKPNEPVGTEFVRPVVGYFCNLCNVIYASEEEAKDEHCRSPSHHEKLKEHKKNASA